MRRVTGLVLHRLTSIASMRASGRLHLLVMTGLLRRLPDDRPFTAAEARDVGVDRNGLDRFTLAGAIRPLVRSVYVARDVEDSIDLRIEALRRVVPRDAVVVDESAAWLHGADVLEPGAHLEVPPVQVFQRTPGRRLRNGLVSSGERRLGVNDVESISGVRLTTPLRTACDLGRLRHRDRALAGMDALLRTGRFGAEHLAGEMDRFKGFRGVLQLRQLIPLTDPGAESPGESAMRLRWYDAGLARPALQWEVPTPYGGSYFLDAALPACLFAAEYDGEEFHSSPEQRAHDDHRRTWLREHEGWTIVVLRREHVYGRRQTADILLRAAFDAVARRLTRHSF